MKRYKERTRGEGDEENKEKDKKFLYHKITLSSSVIFYIPIYASGRRGGGGRGTFSSYFEGGEIA